MANMSLRTCVVVKQIQSYPFLQVACVMLYRMANSGVMPRYVEGLGLTLHHHLGVPQDAISWGKHREQHQAVSRMLLQGNVSVVVVLNSFQWT